MERYCEVPSHPSSAESIRRCHNGQSWSTGEGLNEKYFFLNDLMDLYHRSLVRETPLVISGPILIATAIGIFSSISSISASVIVAKSESSRISTEQNMLRALDRENALKNNLINNEVSVGIAQGLDTLRYITSLSAQTNNGMHNAVQSRHTLNFLFNVDKIIYFNDPGSEKWYSTIEKIVDKNAVGITTSEVKEATRLTAIVSTMTTNMITLKSRTNQCKDALIAKTMMVPVIKFNSSTVFEVRNALLQKKYLNESFTLYFLRIV